MEESMLMKHEIKSKNMHDLAKYTAHLQKHPDLRYLFFELTDSCNLMCRHCGSKCEPRNDHYADTNALLKLIDQIKEDFPNPGFMICLTGGEPLLHPDFSVIAKAINEIDIPWGITTNATLIDVKTAEKLRGLKMCSISVSLDGLKESHEWLRRVTGCFEKTIQGIRNLKDAGHSVQVTTVVSRKNYHELEEVYDLMKSLKVDSWRVVNMDPIGRASEEMADMELSVPEIGKLLRFIRKKRYDMQNKMDVCYGCAHYLSFDYEHEVRDYYFNCESGTTVASILVNGDIYGCLDIERRQELVQGNINDDRFYYVWMTKFKEYRIDRSRLCQTCQNCDEREFCRGDSMHTWDFDSNKPKVCMLMK